MRRRIHHRYRRRIISGRRPGDDRVRGHVLDHLSIVETGLDRIKILISEDDQRASIHSVLVGDEENVFLAAVLGKSEPGIGKGGNIVRIGKLQPREVHQFHGLGDGVFALEQRQGVQGQLHRVRAGGSDQNRFHRGVLVGDPIESKVEQQVKMVWARVEVEGTGRGEGKHCLIQRDVDPIGNGISGSVLHHQQFAVHLTGHCGHAQWGRSTQCSECRGARWPGIHRNGGKIEHEYGFLVARPNILPIFLGNILPGAAGQQQQNSRRQCQVE